MEALTKPNTYFRIKNFLGLTKPGIIFGNAINFLTGFILASKNQINLLLLLNSLIGLSLIIASGCVFNNYIDRELDRKMDRTKDRVLAKGLISLKSALAFAFSLMFLGSIFIVLFTNLLTSTIILLGLFIYVLVYTFIKYRSVYGTLIGSIAGATPPLAGYCAVSNSIDAGAIILFLTIMLWQMPHFFAIAIYRMEDFKAGSIPVLPIKKGIRATKVQMTFYVIAFFVTSLMLTIFNYTSYLFLVVMFLLNSYWLLTCLKGFKVSNDQIWARKIFFTSLIIVISMCISILF